MMKTLRRRGRLMLLVALGLSLMMVTQAGATANNSPLNGSDCMNGQANNGYIFLSGVYYTGAGAEVAERDCAVPAAAPCSSRS